MLMCTEIGCNDQVSIWLRGLEAGHAYEVTIESTDDSVHCSIDTSEGLRGRCGNEEFYTDFRDDTPIAFQGAPESLTITVRQDGAVIAQDTIMPAYQELAPNGRECGPICLQDEILFDI